MAQRLATLLAPTMEDGVKKQGNYRLRQTDTSFISFSSTGQVGNFAPGRERGNQRRGLMAKVRPGRGRNKIFRVLSLLVIEGLKRRERGEKKEEGERGSDEGGQRKYNGIKFASIKHGIE